MHGVSYAPAAWEAFRAKTGFEAHSVCQPYEGALPPFNLPALRGRGKDGADIGASLDPQHVYGPESLMGL